MTAFKPEGAHSLTAYLVIRDAAAAIEFYTAVFGAELVSRMDMPGGKVGHAELRFDDTMLMLSEEFPEQDWKGPESIGGSPVTLFFYVKDVDAVFDAAVKRGAIPVRPVEDQFYGDRSGILKDPFGHLWSIGTHIEDVSEEEMDRRFNEMMGGQS